MRTDRVALGALGLLAVTLIVAGIATVGGPGRGRLEARDDLRRDDLSALSRFVRCVADTNDKTLPDGLTPVGTCERDMRLEDPFTGAPYRYEKVSDTSYRLCAGFEDPQRLADNHVQDIDPATGCIQFTYVR